MLAVRRQSIHNTAHFTQVTQGSCHPRATSHKHNDQRVADCYPLAEQSEPRGGIATTVQDLNLGHGWRGWLPIRLRIPRSGNIRQMLPTSLGEGFLLRLGDLRCFCFGPSTSRVHYYIRAILTLPYIISGSIPIPICPSPRLLSRTVPQTTRASRVGPPHRKAALSLGCSFSQPPPWLQWHTPRARPCVPFPDMHGGITSGPERSPSRLRLLRLRLRLPPAANFRTPIYSRFSNTTKG